MLAKLPLFIKLHFSAEEADGLSLKHIVRSVLSKISGALSLPDFLIYEPEVSQVEVVLSLVAVCKHFCKENQ